MIEAYCDGAYNGDYKEVLNKGAIGIEIKKNGETIFQQSKIVNATSDEIAGIEARAVYNALLWLETLYKSSDFINKNEKITIYSDDKVVIEEFRNKNYKRIERYNSNMKRQFENILSKFHQNEIIFQWIPREKNMNADKLAQNKLKEYFADSIKSPTYFFIRDIERVVETNQCRFERTDSKSEKIQINNAMNKLKDVIKELKRAEKGQHKVTQRAVNM